jgi:hypothetical protein
MAKAKGDQQTGDLFDVAHMFPVEAPRDMPRALDMKRQIARDMGRALRECGKTAEVVAAEMTELLGGEDEDLVTRAQLYAYTAESRTSHTISIVRWVAFVRATGCTWLWGSLLRDEGMIVLEGEEALLAQAAHADKMAQHYAEQAKVLRKRAPLQVKVPRTRR